MGVQVSRICTKSTAESVLGIIPFSLNTLSEERALHNFLNDVRLQLYRPLRRIQTMRSISSLKRQHINQLGRTRGEQEVESPA